MKLVFMGTPDFAVPALCALHEAGHEIACVVSQPDKPKGRHGQLSAPPVKEKALSLGIPVLQPEKASDPAFIEEMRRTAPDAIVVAAYGKILKQALLDIPRYGCINIHASLLPRWRGAAPIQWAVIAGDRTAGVTTMQMDAGLDTGDMLLKREIELAPDETGGSLFERLSALGGPLIVETLKKAEDGSLLRTPQPKTGMTYAPILKKEMGDIDWSKSSEEIERLVRGLSPWPGTFSSLNGKTLKIHQAVLLDVEQKSGQLTEEPQREKQHPVGALEHTVSDAAGKAVPGRMLIEGERLFVVCGDGMLELLEVQLEGKKRMTAAEFLRGAGRLVHEAGVLSHSGL